jgi:serine/threonine protein kinase
VYLAVVMGSSGFRKLAVVKLLRPEIAVDSEFVQMFLDEARLCARLSHPNIVHTYDVGVDKLGYVLAMEYLDGVSYHAGIAKLGKNGGPLKFPLQAKILLEVLEGLRYAHELPDYDGRSLQIVHRDVTPQNIFLTYNGQVKLLDFGIAKTAASSVNTATGVIKGKLTYMAPEQARGDPVDARTDLYAVGVMLWEAIAGKRRWPTGLSQTALFLRLATGELPENPNSARPSSKRCTSSIRSRCAISGPCSPMRSRKAASACATRSKSNFAPSTPEDRLPSLIRCPSSPRRAS